MIRRYVARRRRKGSFLLEMAVVSWVLLYMLIGSFQVGLMMVRGIQAGNLCRNANVLEARRVDLSQSINQELLLRTSPSLGINTSGTWTASSSGAGLVVLSQVYKVGDLMCASGVSGYVSGNAKGNCPNYGVNVISMRINIGNTSTYGPGVVGSPSSTPGSTGFMTDAQNATVTGNAASSAIANLITLGADQYTWVAEVYADSKNFNIFPWFQAPTIYMRNLS